MRMTRFIVDLSDPLCRTLEAAGEVTAASRSDVLAALIRVHTQQLRRFMDQRPETLDEDNAAVTVAEIGDCVDVHFLEACATHPHELALIVKAFGLTKPLDR